MFFGELMQAFWVKHESSTSTDSLTLNLDISVNVNVFLVAAVSGWLLVVVWNKQILREMKNEKNL
jgi:hypothetical protein